MPGIYHEDPRVGGMFSRVKVILRLDDVCSNPFPSILNSRAQSALTARADPQTSHVTKSRAGLLRPIRDPRVPRDSRRSCRLWGKDTD